MKTSMQFRSFAVALVLLSATAIFVAGCSSTVASGGAGTGAAFVVGTDAPMASVVSFTVPVESITVTPTGGTPVNLLAAAQTVDFARFNGLQTLLDMNSIPAGTYTSVSVTLGAATIGFLNSGGGRPTIATEAATYPGGAATYTFTQTLPSPVVVANATAPVGVRVDLDLHQSIGVDGSGNITGLVTPVFDLRAVHNNEPGAYIDNFDATVESVNAGANTCVVTGPHGRSFTVNAGTATWEGTDTIHTLTVGSIVSISGTLDRVDATIDADSLAILTTTGFWAGGLVTYVAPTSGVATSFDMYLRGLLGATTGLTLGDIATVDLSGSNNPTFFIYRWHNRLTQFLFNSSSLLPGQHVSVGGPDSGLVNAATTGITVNRVVLRHWGFNATVVPGSVNTTHDSFQVTINGFAGQLIPQTVTVYTGVETLYRGGLTQLTDVSNVAVPANAFESNIRIVGLLIKNPIPGGNPILLAHYVDELQ